VDVLTDANFLVYAASRYRHGPRHADDDFLEDLRRIRYVKKLLTRFVETGELRERLILNHVIVLTNAFGPEAACKLLYLKAEKQFPYLKPFLEYLSVLPDRLHGVDDRTVDTGSIVKDLRVEAALARL